MIGPALKSFYVDLSFINKIEDSFNLTLRSTPRNWSNVVGLLPPQTELFIERSIRGASQQFNFWQERSKERNLKSENVFEWVREKKEWNDIPWNLIKKRNIIQKQTEEFINTWRPLKLSIEQKAFWIEMNKAFNLEGFSDPVFKKPILVKMILEDSGFISIYKKDSWGFGCIDYNIPIVLDYYNIFS